MSAKHGTYAGHRAHKRRGEDPCEPCRAASTAYARERRAAKKSAADAAPAAWPTRPDVEGLITFAAVASQAGSQVWNAEVWDLAPDQRRWLRYGTLETIEADGGIEFIERLVNQFDVQVVVMTNDDIAFWLARSAGYTAFIERLRVRETVLYHVSEIMDPADQVLGVRATIERAYRDPELKILPKSSPGDYVKRKLEEIQAGGQHHLRADWLGEVALPRIPYASTVAAKRRERDAEDPEHPRRIQSAVVARGRMLEVGRYERPEPEYEPIPAGHEALRSESWVGVIAPAKKGRGRWSGGRR